MAKCASCNDNILSGDPSYFDEETKRKYCLNCVGSEDKRKKTNEKKVDSTVYKKNKTTAVILSIFLGPFSWLYTYRENKIYFWSFIIILLIFPSPLTPAPFWWMAIGSAVFRSQEWYNQYYIDK